MYSEKDISAIRYVFENLLGDNVLKEIEMSKRQDILNKHIETICKIQQMQGKDTRYYTYVWLDAQHKKKKYFKHTKKEDVEQDVVNFYKAKEKSEQATLDSIYDEWLNYKMLQSNTNSNAQRLNSEWKRYYANDEIVHKPVRELNSLYLETWALEKIVKYQLTRKCYNNMATIVRQMLDYCKKKGLVENNQFKEFDINKKKYVKQVRKTSQTEVFFSNEQEEVETLAYGDFLETGNVECLAVCLNFLLGMRLGELVALKTTDFEPENNCVHVCRSEVKDYYKDGDNFVLKGTLVQEYLKAGKEERIVYYPEKVNILLNLIIDTTKAKRIKGNDFLFLDQDGHRANERAIDTRIRKYCRYAGINPRGMHKTRKTYISTLLEKGMSPNAVKDQVGHSDLQTTFNNYYFSLTRDEEKAKKLNDIFNKKEVE